MEKKKRGVWEKMFLWGKVRNCGEKNVSSLVVTHFKSLDNILHFSVVKKKFSTQLKVNTSLRSITISQNL